MNVRGMMGKLAAPSARYDSARGGTPELTAQDIAAAIGMAKNRLAREVFCLIWFPDLAEKTRAETAKALRDAMMREFCDRARAYQAACLEAHIATCEAAVSARRITEHDRRELERAKSAVGATKAGLWPAVMATYPRIIEAVITEISTPRHCNACGGRKEIMVLDLLRPCEKCAGTGAGHAPKIWRAKQIGVKESAYHNVWKPVYEWTINYVSGLEHIASIEIARALGKDATDIQ